MLTTGVYLDQHRHTAIAVRVKEGKVIFLAMNVTKPVVAEGRRSYEVVSQQVTLCTLADVDFAHQYEVFLHNYPVTKAARAYYRSGLTVTPEAEKVIRLLLANNATRSARAKP